MFRNHKTLIMLAVVALTVGYAVYDFQNEKATENAKSENSRVLPIEKDQVQEVLLTRFDSSASAPTEIFKLQRTQEGWKIAAPIEEVADQNATVDFVEGVTLEKSKDLVKQGAGIDWKLYGLDKPKAILQFKLNSGTEYKILISASKNYSGDPYIRVEGQDKVLVGNTTWNQKIEKRPFDFRDKRIMNKSAVSITKFQLLQSGAKFDKKQITLLKKDSNWELLEKPDWIVDQNKASEVVYMLNSTNVLEMTQENEIKLTDLKKYDLDKPLFKVQVNLEKDKKWSADFSKTPQGEHFILISEPKRIVKIAAQDFDKFQKVTMDYFRNRRFAFNFNREDVKKVHVEISDLKADFEKKNDEWIVVNPDSKYSYDSARVMAVVALVRNLDVGDFEPKQTDLSAAKYKIRFDSEDGKNILTSEFGEIYQKKEGEITKAFLLAKTSLSKTLFGVDEGSFKAMGLESLVTKKSEKPGVAKDEKK